MSTERYTPIGNELRRSCGCNPRGFMWHRIRTNRD